ncbi:HAS-barrel domain-containing protein [Synechocystis sp. LKSZ1]|uniref:HAS-barrel domain-containing protein n=1 Tax=Synechocystis sp. LKSZ1 TaxID=3144951 RepID=UPI00336C1FFD
MRLPLPQFVIEERPPQHIAEVIETSSTGFLAQCLEPEDLSFPAMPPFGSWVQARDEESQNLIFGIVSHVTTAPIDSVHRARAMGLSLAELREQQPQIFAMLKTEFYATLVGFEQAPASNNGHHRGSIYHYLPPCPPQIHQAVYQCAPEEVIHFSEKPDFLRILLEVKEAPVDALVAATVRGVYGLRKGDHRWLVNVGRHLSLLLKDDYDRLRYILSQVHL